MDLTAFSVTLVMNALMLLLPAFVHNGLSHKPERTFPCIVPSKLQFFEFANLTVNCEGFFNNMTKWRVIRRISAGKMTTCNKDSEQFGTCHIMVLYKADSGEYWCETNNKERSERVRITVTAGDVILESPVRPVMVGDNVTLHCIEKTKHKKTSTKFSFYKDRVLLKTSSTGEMTIYNVSVSDQGQYRCNISENKFSEENLLQVRAVLLECPDRPMMKDEDVTLFCRDKMAAPNYTSYFYKDGNLIRNSSTGNLTLYGVSKMDEGVYKCKTSEDRESEEEWLAVRDISVTSVHDVLEVTHFTASPLIELVGLPILLLLLVFICIIYKDWCATGGTETCAVAKPKSKKRAAVFGESEQGTVVYSVISDFDVKTDDLNGSALANETEGEMYSTVQYGIVKTDNFNGFAPANESEEEMYSTVLYNTVSKTRRRRRTKQ